MGRITEFRNGMRFNPPILPDAFWLAYNSIARAAVNAKPPPSVILSKEKSQEVYRAWVAELQKYVAANGKFTKFEVIYVPFSPPPFFWDYKCGKCRWWIQGGCQLVDGTINARGWCAVPGTLTPTHRGVLPIEEVIPGDIGYSLNGAFHSNKIAAISMREYSGRMYKLQANYLLPLTVTPEHILYVQRFISSTTNKRKTGYAMKLFSPEEMTAERLYQNVMAGDKYRILQPYPLNEESSLGLDGILARFLGIFMAEAHILYRDDEPAGAGFDFGEEPELINFIEEVCSSRFSDNSTVRPNSRGGLNVRVHSSKLAKFILKYFNGSHSANGKSLSNDVLYLPRSLQRDLLQGMLIGDGHTRGTNNQLGSSSPSLIWQSEIILWRSGTTGSMGKMREGGDKVIISGREVNRGPFYRLSWYPKPNGGRLIQEEPGLLSFMVRKIAPTQYSGPVHDLSMINEPNFITLGGLSHNCAIWLPPDSYKPFTWPQELLAGNW